jgi:hypothetical protein
MAVSSNSQPHKQRLVKTLETQVNESDTSSFEVSEQRERNHRYYTMEPLGNEIPGRSHYVSPDVLDAVEGKKAIFSETFLSAREVIKFTECSYPGEAAAKTAYVNRTFRKNKYERLLRDAWHDAFVAKRCVMHVEWFDDDTTEVLELQGTPMPAVQQQLQQMGEVIDVDDSQLQVQQMPSPQGMMQILSGQLTVTLADGYARMTLIQPERYYRDPAVAYGDQAAWNTIEEDITRGQLIDLGFDADQVNSLAVDYRFRSDEEDAARKRHDSSWTQRRRHNRVEAQELVTYYRTWTWLDGAADDIWDGLELDFEPEPGYRLYEIHWSMGEVLTREGVPAIREVEEHGIFEWAEMKISHAENGTCTADVVAHTQKTVSGLKRLIIDNQQMVNNTRYVALSGALKNPRDLLDNRIGGTLWAKRPDAVTPLAQPALSALTFQTLQMMKSDGEERSGISGLAKGMNTDAVKYQNADNMIDRLTTAGQRRVTAAARDFATTFLVPIAKHIARLGKENDRSQDTLEAGGQQIPIIPAQWQDDVSDMEVAAALTPDEAKQQAQQLLMLNQMLAQDEDMRLSYGTEQKHKMYDKVFELLGVADSSELLLAPSDPRFQQAAQQQQQQAMQAAQKQDQAMQIQLGATQAQVDALKSSDQREWEKFSWDRTDSMADNLLNTQKAEWDYEVKSEANEIKEQAGGR